MTVTQNATYREEDKLDDGLSPTWVMIGVVMFATALGAPVVVSQLHGDRSTTVSRATDTTRGKTITTASRDAKRPSEDPGPFRSLATVLSEGPVTPGVGIGPVLLDTSVDQVLRQIEEPPKLSFMPTEHGLQGQYEIESTDFNLTILTDRDQRLVNSVALAAPDCADLRNFQPRQDGLPATAEGLSLGSHVSRVRTTLGAPDAQSPVSGLSARVEHSYPGLKLSYCVQDMLVGEIKVERLPPAPLIGTPGMSDPAVETPDLTDVLIAQAQHLSQDQARPLMPAGAQRQTPQPTPIPGPADEPLVFAMKPDALGDAKTAPTPLLAMNGSAFTAGDAFSLSREKRTNSQIARAAAPQEIVANTTRLVTVEDADSEFQGVSTFLQAKAEIAEAELELSRKKQGIIQRRLQLIGYDPSGVDGIFGPNTREVIAKLQVDNGMPGTGYLDPLLIDVIMAQSERRFAQWQRDVRLARARARDAADKRRAEAAARARRDSVVIARVPAPRNAPGCARDNRGVIISNQSFSCDVTVLEESLTNLFAGRS